MISGVGVLLGSLMTVGFNVWLVDLMNFPKIDWWGIPLGIVCLPDFTGKRDKDRI